MAKFGGKIGFSITKEVLEYNEETGENVKTGRIKEEIVEKDVYGDVLRFSYGSKSNENTSNIDDISLSNRFSILGDPFCFENFHLMKYIEWLNVKWKVKSVDVEYPRLIISVGDVYND